MAPALALAQLALAVLGAGVAVKALAACAPGSTEQCEAESGGAATAAAAAHAYSEAFSQHHMLADRAVAQLGAAGAAALSGCGLHCFDQQLEADLKLFGAGIPRTSFDHARGQGTLFQVISGRLYRESRCVFPTRCSGIQHFLLKLAPELPDTEFVVNVFDGPRTSVRAVMPVFSFSKTPAFGDLMFPAWTFWAGGPAISFEPRGLGRWDLKRESLSARAGAWPWAAKREVAFFRGSRTSAERDPLILLSRAHPGLVDAQYTKNQAWKSDADTLGRPAAKEVALEDHCEYKYLFNLRGVAASFRHKHLFLCGSLVLHVGDQWLEFYYTAMKPWIHYIPVRTDLADAESLVRFAKANDGLAKRIASAGREFVLRALTMDAVTAYWRRLLLGYTALLQWDPVRDTSLDEIVAS